jgi:inorganic pyrophosphatase
MRSKHFFERSIKLYEPGKEVLGGDWVGHDAAQEEIDNSYRRFQETVK